MWGLPLKLTLVRAVTIAAAVLLGLLPASGLPSPALAADRDQDGIPGVAASVPASTGYDISWPQCGGAYPANPAFGIVGVNAGIVFSANPCVTSQISWAGGARAGLYANTGNPGPALSKHWPLGQTTPRFCDPANPDSADCAYDYGANAATDSWSDAVTAFAALALAESPATSSWWLDVETSNSWRSDVSLNVAALSGATDALGARGVTKLGFYSTQYQWNVITGGTAAFAGHPSWVAGAADASGAAALCGTNGFTGGGVALGQYITGGFDADLACVDGAPILTTVTVSPPTASIQANGTQQLSARADDQFGQPLNPQPPFSWSTTGGAVTPSGLYTAGSTAGGPFTVTADSGGVRGSATVTVTSAADFSVSASPAVQSVRRGATATWNISIVPGNGFNGSVSWAVAGQPAGAIVSFTVNPTTSSTTLTLKTASSGPKGAFTLTITARSGSLAHTATVTLKVTK